MTRGTILANRKLSLRRLVMAIAVSVQSVKGKSACQLKRELGIDYKSAFCLLHKLREAWREDRRRTDFRTQARLVLAAALAHPVSRNLARYWQTTSKAASCPGRVEPVERAAAEAAMADRGSWSRNVTLSVCISNEIQTGP